MNDGPGSTLTAVYNDGHMERSRTTSIAIKRREFRAYLHINT